MSSAPEERRDREPLLPRWVWVVVVLGFLWAGVWYLGFSLPSYLRGP